MTDQKISKRVSYELYKLHLESTLCKSKYIVFTPRSTTIYFLIGAYLNRLKPLHVGIDEALKDTK